MLFLLSHIFLFSFENKICLCPIFLFLLADWYQPLWWHDLHCCPIFHQFPITLLLSPEYHHFIHYSTTLFLAADCLFFQYSLSIFCGLSLHSLQYDAFIISFLLSFTNLASFSVISVRSSKYSSWLSTEETAFTLLSLLSRLHSLEYQFVQWSN